MNKTLVLMRGLPGGGKTYLAHEIFLSTMKYLEYKDCTKVYLSTDSIFEADAEGLADKAYLWSHRVIAQAHEVNQEKCRIACEKKFDLIVIDNTNVDYNSIYEYLKHANEFGYEVHIHEPKTAWKFDVEECFKRNSHGVPRESIERMLRKWESKESILDKIKTTFPDLKVNYYE